MAFKKILVAFDGSDLSKKALELAADIARMDSETQLDVVYAATVPAFAVTDASSMQAVIDSMAGEGEEVISQAQDILKDLGDRVETKLVRGVYPADEILVIVETGGYDLVVMGSRGLGGIKEYIGSVSHKVLHNSSAPVLIAK
ncbi:MAG: universal stress protein [Raoultibacter sp.]